jgi:hypothetical protein
MESKFENDLIGILLDVSKLEIDVETAQSKIYNLFFNNISQMMKEQMEIHFTPKFLKSQFEIWENGDWLPTDI